MVRRTEHEPLKEPENAYTWERAKVGDKAPGSVEEEVRMDRIQQYVDGEDDYHRLYVDPEFAKRYGFTSVAVPFMMTVRVAADRRQEIARARGMGGLGRPTPYTHLEVRTYAPLNVGDVITSTCEIARKEERRERHYLTRYIVGYNQKGEKVIEYWKTNLWDAGKPGDRLR